MRAAPVVCRVAHSQGVARSGAVLVFDQTDDYFSSRDVFQQLYTHGNYARIACVSASAVRAKKMMLGREARYSGLIDALEIIEAADVTAPAVAEAAGYGIWVILNAEQSKLGAQLAAAKAAGVTRLLVTFSADGVSDAAALEATLAASGLRYTAMRTGELSKQIEGSALVRAACLASAPRARAPCTGACPPPRRACCDGAARAPTAHPAARARRVCARSASRRWTRRRPRASRAQTRSASRLRR